MHLKYMNPTKYQKFAFGLLVYTILVILWGAWVRISHSGDGCGDTWPLCHGKLIPEAEQNKTWVEYGHRLMSGLYGLVVIYFWLAARKLYGKDHFTRKAALATFVFTISEALLGAKLVLFKLVTDNDTPYRAFVMALHQLNSFMLTGAVALALASALHSSGHLEPSKKSDRHYRFFPLIIIVIGITGAWASLSNTLFPTQDLLLGLQQDLSSDSHFLLRLRGLHPILATLGAGGLALFFWLKTQSTESIQVRQKSYQMSLLLAVGIAFGILTLLLHAPVWMKIVHLCLAHCIWVVLLQWLYFFRQQRVQP